MGKIPKIIHYCWFGKKPYPQLMKKCMHSWEKHLPDYKLVEWNEDNFDINSLQYVREAYQAQKWAFVSDYVRLYAIYTHGGIYVDTDVEVLRSFDLFLSNIAFTGFESDDSPITAVIGCEKGCSIIRELMDYYNDRSFILPDGNYDITTNTTIITEILSAKNLLMNGKKQVIDELTIYPQIYFAPNTLLMIFNRYSKKTYAVHHFAQSWRENARNYQKLMNRVRKYFVGILRNTVKTDRLMRVKRHFDI